MAVWQRLLADPQRPVGPFHGVEQGWETDTQPGAPLASPCPGALWASCDKTSYQQREGCVHFRAEVVKYWV